MRELDEYFKDAAAELREFHLSSQPPAPPAHVFSAQFELSMRRMIERELLTHKGARLSALAKRGCGFALSGALAVTACILCVGMWSSTFFTTVSAHYPDQVSISLPGFIARPSVGIPLTYELTAVPTDFYRVRHGRDPKGFLNYTVFENNKGQIISFEQTPAAQSSPEAVSQGEDLGELTLPLGTARLRRDGARHMIEWQAYGYRFMLYSNLPREQTVALAESAALKIHPFETMQPLPIEAVPAQYPQALALQNGDVVFTADQPPANLQKLLDFITACELKQPSVIRLAEYVGSSILLHDLETNNGRIYYTRDEQRRPSSAQPWESGEIFEDISLLSSGGKHVLLLHTRLHTDPVKVLQYY